MTAKEKAKELVDRFEPMCLKYEDSAKQCAIICVDEIQKIFTGLHKPEYVTFDIYEPKQYHMEEDTDYNGYAMSEYWQQVKEEINGL